MLMNKTEMSQGARADGGSSVEFNTGTWRAMRPIIEKDKCINCMLCYLYCPDNSITITKEGPNSLPVLTGVDLKHCKGCSICAHVCPVKCIHMISEDEAKKGDKK